MSLTASLPFATVHLNALSSTLSIQNLIGILQLPNSMLRVEKKARVGINPGPLINFSDPNSTTISGPASVAKALVRMSAFAEGLLGNSVMEACQVDQWIERCLCDLEPAAMDVVKVKSAVRSINTYLSDRTFLVGDHFSLADIFLYLTIHDFFVGLPAYDKEDLQNLSRWFDQVQNTPRVRQKLRLVHFQKTLLYS